MPKYTQSVDVDDLAEYTLGESEFQNLNFLTPQHSSFLIDSANANKTDKSFMYAADSVLIWSCLSNVKIRYPDFKAEPFKIGHSTIITSKPGLGKTLSIGEIRKKGELLDAAIGKYISENNLIVDISSTDDPINGWTQQDSLRWGKYLLNEHQMSCKRELFCSRAKVAVTEILQHGNEGVFIVPEMAPWQTEMDKRAGGDAFSLIIKIGDSFMTPFKYSTAGLSTQAVKHHSVQFLGFATNEYLPIIYGQGDKNGTTNRSEVVYINPPKRNTIVSMYEQPIINYELETHRLMELWKKINIIYIKDSNNNIIGQRLRKYSEPYIIDFETSKVAKHDYEWIKKYQKDPDKLSELKKSYPASWVDENGDINESILTGQDTWITASDYEKDNNESRFCIKFGNHSIYHTVRNLLLSITSTSGA